MRKLKINLRFLKNLPAHEKKLTLSSLFTLARIALVPFIVGAMIAQQWGVAFFLFVVASATDFFDGYIARLRNEQTFLGACLDPLADKLLVLSCFFTLAFVSTPFFKLPSWFVWAVLFKELILIVGAGAMYAIKGHLEVRPTWLSKITTVVQLSFIAWLFACYFFGWFPVKTYYTMLGVVLVMVFAALVQYAVIGMKQWGKS